jgi:hypothetical protein
VKGFRLALALALVCGSAATAADTTVAHLYDSQLSGVEREIVALVEAMPESAFAFAPKDGAFTGVRTFAQQARHVAAVLYMLSASAMQQKPPVDPGKGENGPDSVATKAQVVKFLQDAFVYTHKAVNSLTAKSQVEMVKPPFKGAPDMARGELCVLAISHTMDHYGQMVIYARMNRVIPPASR